MLLKRGRIKGEHGDVDQMLDSAGVTQKYEASDGELQDSPNLDKPMPVVSVSRRVFQENDDLHRKLDVAL